MRCRNYILTDNTVSFHTVLLCSDSGYSTGCQIQSVRTGFQPSTVVPVTATDCCSTRNRSRLSLPPKTTNFRLNEQDTICCLSILGVQKSTQSSTRCLCWPSRTELFLFEFEERRKLFSTTKMSANCLSYINNFWTKLCSSSIFIFISCSKLSVVCSLTELMLPRGQCSTQSACV